MTIPSLPPFILPGYPVMPLPDVVPFTSRSGATFAEVFYGYKDYIDNVVVPNINKNNAELTSNLNTLVTNFLNNSVDVSAQIMELIASDENSAFIEILNDIYAGKSVEESVSAVAASVAEVDEKVDESNVQINDLKRILTTGRLSEQGVKDAINTAVIPTDKKAILANTRPSTVIALGTSITNQGSFNTSGGANQFQNGTDDVGYLSHAIVRLNHSLRVLRNAGVSGNNSAQMLARLQADVLNYAPGWVIVETGAPNDIGFGMTLPQSIANHKAIYDAIEATGARVVATTPMPYGLNDASNSTARRQFISGLRRWIIKYAQERGHVIADFYPALVREDGTGLWRGTGWSDGTNATQSDGIHPKPPAAALAGKILADAIRPHISDRKGLWLPGGNVDTWNLLSNGMMFGNNGSTKPAGVTGDLATAWSAYGAVGTGGAGTLSKVPRTDSVHGEWQQYTATAGNTDGFNFQQQNTAGLGSTWNVGDVVVAAIEFETDNDWVGGVQMGLLLSATGSSHSVQDLRHAGSNTGWAPGASSGVLAAKMTIGAGATRLQVQASVRMTTGTVRFGRAGLWNLTQMVAAGIIDAEFLAAPTI